MTFLKCCITRVIPVALLACVFAANAEPVAIANFAPDTNLGPGISVEIDGASVATALPYKGFASADLARSVHQVVVRRADGSVLAAGSFDEASAPDHSSPTLAILGNGTTQPHEVFLVRKVVIRHAGEDPENNVALVHLAPFEAAETTDLQHLVTFEYHCEFIDGPTHSAGDGSDRMKYKDEAFFGATDPQTCSFTLANFAIANLHIDGITMTRDGIVRVYLVGDGVNAPFELVAAKGAERVDATASQPSNLPELTSTTIWSDQDRPAEGIAVYEVGLSGNVAVTWFTFGADTKAVWYYLDGVPAMAPGWRDLVVYRIDRQGGAQHSTPVGSARLIYQDCNHANLRIVLGNDDFRSLRLKRTVEVPRCAALN